jgi:hypothetical protein
MVKVSGGGDALLPPQAIGRKLARNTRVQHSHLLRRLSSKPAARTQPNNPNATQPAYSAGTPVGDNGGMTPADDALVLIVSVEVAGLAPGVTEAGERLQGSVGTTEQVSETAFGRLPRAVIVRTSLATEPFCTVRLVLAGLTVKSTAFTVILISTLRLPIRFDGSSLTFERKKKSFAA